MKRLQPILIPANFLLIIAVIIYLFFERDRNKIAFIYSQRVFQEYNGTKFLMEKLSLRNSVQKKGLDSLTLLIRNGRSDLQAIYEAQLRDHTAAQQGLSERYTTDIWKRINADIADYGKENGFDYILGASGNGSLMYSHDLNDITDDVIMYLNSKYEGN